MNPGTASILICSRNRIESLRQTVASIRQLEIPTNLSVELIVVDNGSTDGTSEYLDQLHLPNMSVRWVEEAKPGVGNARNAAVRASIGEVLLFTDDDTRLPRNWIAAMCEPILTGRADAVAGCIELAPELQRDWMRPLHRALLASTDRLDLENPQEMFGASMAFSRRVLRDVPAFDSELGPGTRIGGMEDTLFSWQIKQAGYKIVAVNHAVVVHHPEPSRLSRLAYMRGARQYGRSLAYLHHHWLHQPPRSLQGYRSPHLNLLYRRASLWGRRWKRRVLGRGPAPEGLPLWELGAIQKLEEVHTYLKERRRPPNYEKLGLVRRDHVRDSAYEH